MARELANRSPEAIEAVKRISDIAPRLDKASALDLELDVEALLFTSAKRKEHMDEFMKALKNRKRNRNDTIFPASLASIRRRPGQIISHSLSGEAKSRS